MFIKKDDVYHDPHKKSMDGVAGGDKQSMSLL